MGEGLGTVQVVNDVVDDKTQLTYLSVDSAEIMCFRCTCVGMNLDSSLYLPSFTSFSDKQTRRESLAVGERFS